ncbi:hypothetical protein [Nocardia grenadensis]|uniref:hypothetical protein n=1 Tax=Nocardia grenadensis TaxID=931537 RepID=UPI0007A4AB32|nr:hypothetical protein [Nocardia grenadensis]
MTESALSAMGRMVGEWNTTTSLYPDITGHTVIEWMPDARFLVVHYTVPEAGISLVQVVGADDLYQDRLVILQYDQTGEHRIYQGSFDGPLWRVWRDAPGASQRFTGNLDEAGNTMRATWERSDSELDPRSWDHDFDIVFTRIC